VKICLEVSIEIRLSSTWAALSWFVHRPHGGTFDAVGPSTPTDGIRDPDPNTDAASQAVATQGFTGSSVRPIVISFGSLTPASTRVQRSPAVCRSAVTRVFVPVPAAFDHEGTQMSAQLLALDGTASPRSRGLGIGRSILSELTGARQPVRPSTKGNHHVATTYADDR
jgi:hypothetical protein